MGLNKFKVGDVVFLHDQFTITGPYSVAVLHDGCDCCDLYRGTQTFYQLNNGPRYYSDNYLFLTREEAEASIVKWEAMREKFRKNPQPSISYRLPRRQKESGV